MADHGEAFLAPKVVPLEATDYFNLIRHWGEASLAPKGSGTSGGGTPSAVKVRRGGQWVSSGL